MRSAVTDTGVVDEKAGWSSFCRHGDIRTCEDLQARCTNPGHSRGRRGQIPPPPPPVRMKKENPMPTPVTVLTNTRIAPESGVKIDWADPPTAGTGRGRSIQNRFVAELKVLKDNPGRWARLCHYQSKSGATSAGKRFVAENPGFEAAGRLTNPGSDLYVRWVG